MIKEIAEEYYQKALNNLIDILNKVKDFEYKLVEKKRNFRTLEYYNKTSKWGVRIYFQNKYINGISLFKRDNNDMFIIKSTEIHTIYHTKEVKVIEEELYNKYLVSKK